MSLTRQFGTLFRRFIVHNNFQISETRSIKRWVAPTLRELQRRRDKVGPEPIEPRSTFLEWNYEAEIFAFGKRLGEEFDKILLKQALTDRSYISLQQTKTETDKEADIQERLADNSDLIKQGETIINNCIEKNYATKYPEYMFVDIHKYLTSMEMLSFVGSNIGLKDIVLTAEFPVEKETLANSFKSVVGALKNSQNLERANLFVQDFLICQMNEKEITDLWEPENPYNLLENTAKTKGLNNIEPRLCNKSAVNTILANFQVGIYSDKKLIGMGWGESVDIAKNTAAIDALKKINNISA